MIEDRVKRVSIDPRVVFELFRMGSKKLVVDGIPSDAQYIGVAYDAISNTWQMFCTHESFEPVRASDQIPQLVCTVDYE